jgi:hypothetical protein
MKKILKKKFYFKKFKKKIFIEKNLRKKLKRKIFIKILLFLI